MVKFKKRDTAYVIEDGIILSYDLINGEVDLSSEGKLTAITQDDVKEVEKLLNITSIEDYDVEILLDEEISLFDSQYNIDTSTVDKRISRDKLSNRYNIFKTISNQQIKY